MKARPQLAYGLVVVWAVVCPFLYIKRHDAAGWIAHIISSLWLSVPIIWWGERRRRAGAKSE